MHQQELQPAMVLQWEGYKGVSPNISHLQVNPPVMQLPNLMTDSQILLNTPVIKGDKSPWKVQRRKSLHL